MKTKTILLAILVIAIVGAILYLQGLTSGTQDVERTEIARTVEENVSDDVQNEATLTRIAEKTATYPKAIELVEPNAYINTDPFTLADEIGKKVIMIDFWTYSCINCQRTFPYLISWDQKYRDDGLLIVGVHTPEFDFEKDLGNVQRAVEKYGITYPVVLDNDRKTWSAYKNRYWPRHYIIDIDGFIVDDHIGEGAYVETEQKIQDLLRERREVLGLDVNITDEITDMTPTVVRSATPEIYFGYETQRGHLGNVEGWQPEQIVTYALPEDRTLSKFYLQGAWKNNPDNMESAGGNVFLSYAAQSVNIVASADEPTTIQVFVDGEHTKDVVIEEADLYALDTRAYGKHELELRVPAGVECFTFTFG